MTQKLTLHEYQKRAIKIILKKKKIPLFLFPGAGKTVTTLVAIDCLLSNARIKSVLIIAPLYVAQSVWHTEAAKWYRLNELTFSFIMGTEKQRLKGLETKANIYIVNRDNVVWLMKRQSTFDMIVIDESSSFKNPASKRFKALKKATYEYMIELSGTPSPNGLLDLWSQIYLIDRGKRLGETMTSYKRRYFFGDYFGYNFTPIDPQLIYDQIKDITFTMGDSDYLELPERIDLITLVTIQQTKQYKELEKQFITTIDDHEITTANAATLAGKLLQFCNGAVYDENKNIIEVHNAKLDALECIINDNPNENILIAYNFKSDLKRLKERFKDAYILTPGSDAIEKWNRGEIKLLLCHPASSGKGLNLQSGGRMIIWFGLTWNLEDYLQFNARLHRQGQTKPVVINHLVTKDGIDEKVMQSLKNKEICQKDLLDNLTEYIKEKKYA